jgi:hypothetical protein
MLLYPLPPNKDTFGQKRGFTNSIPQKVMVDIVPIKVETDLREALEQTDLITLTFDFEKELALRDAKDPSNQMSLGDLSGESKILFDLIPSNFFSANSNFSFLFHRFIKHSGNMQVLFKGLVHARHSMPLQTQ